MAISREKKEKILERIRNIFMHAPSVAFVNFHRLTVVQANELRRTLRRHGVGYCVAKKTLIHRVLSDAKMAGTPPTFEGETAIAYLDRDGTDALAPAREIWGFQKKFEKAVQLIGGIFGGAFKGREEMAAMASIPPRETLIAQLVNLLNSPATRLASALGQVAKMKG